jgi:low temperature requirement protein LtrA
MTSRTFLRTPSAHGHHRVTYVELLFDLVFVFAITQISHLLIAHFSAATAAQSLLLLLATWWVWIFTTWVTNWIDPERPHVRAVLLAMTVVGLVLSAAIPQAFHARGLAFAGAYVLMQVGRAAFVVWAVRRENSRMARTFRRVLAWLALSGVFWIAGGLADESVRMTYWAVALAIEVFAPTVGFWIPGFGRASTTDWNVEGGHLAERCGLFVMIALGESVVVTGATFANLEWTSSNVAAFLASMIASLAMWWLYFGNVADAGGTRLSRSHDPGWLARLAYTYVHILFVAGIVVSAVGDQFTLAHPTGPSDAKTAMSVLGGAAIYLVGSIFFRWSIGARVGYSSVIVIAALGAVACVAEALTPLALMTATAVVLVALVVVETRAHSSSSSPGPTRRIAMEPTIVSRTLVGHIWALMQGGFILLSPRHEAPEPSSWGPEQIEWEDTQ